MSVLHWEMYVFYTIWFHVHSYGCSVSNKTEFLASHNLTEEAFQENPIINWDAILWVKRPLFLWVVQSILAFISLTEALLLAYLGYKVRLPSPYYCTPWYIIIQHNILCYITYYVASFDQVVLSFFFLRSTNLTMSNYPPRYIYKTSRPVYHE